MTEQDALVPCPMCEEIWCLVHEVHAYECGCFVREEEIGRRVQDGRIERRDTGRNDSIG